MTAAELWQEFLDQKQAQGYEVEDFPFYEAFQFGLEAQTIDDLARLVKEGIKTATASAYPMYELDQAPLPQTGTYSIVMDSEEQAVCLIQTTEVRTVPFNQVSEAHAYKEGEGDRSLTYWRRVHEDFFKQELAQVGLDFSQDMPVVCEEFRVVKNSE
ncbi:ASCH domain-containing protein [Streptococcus downei]|uniref:ASCH domain-containing protein n=1 Tax=Streptococcus downei MFe28 TaxID=764290 RepID=A0A380JGY3_STRDO|nr:ASCH domain-containing protein [Streptococcus downei]EFQ57577.1 ASCH domain protein [Streptococcus downei F0415]SUN36327.1 ASCH domain-containing protein [Streptococcus downei MFe28]